MKILVTGAGGYIGSVATYLLLKQGHEVIALDNFQTGYRRPLQMLQDKFGKEKLKWYKKDIHENAGEIFENHKGIDIVIHYAASCLVDESMKNPYKYFYNNVEGSLNLLETMINFGIKNIVFSSTAAVYGEAQYLPIDEKHPLIPLNVYGESKMMVERLLHWYGTIRKLNYIILRYFNVCGASDDGMIGDSKKPSTLLVQNAVRGALGIEPFKLTAPEVDTPDKTPIRDYINVVDLNEAHLGAIDYLLQGGKSDVFNLGTDTGNSVAEIVDKVQEVTGKKFNVQKTVPRKGDPARLVASIVKAKSVLNWAPKRSIEDSVKSLVTWYTNHPNGWEE